MKNIFRIVGYLEAFSFLFLLAYAMPMKYIYGDLTATKIPGMVHGQLFLLYLVLAYNMAAKEQWSSKLKWTAFFASVLPFGTLVFDYCYLRKITDKSSTIVI